MNLSDTLYIISGVLIAIALGLYVTRKNAWAHIFFGGAFFVLAFQGLYTQRDYLTLLLQFAVAFVFIWKAWQEQGRAEDSPKD